MSGHPPGYKAWDTHEEYLDFIRRFPRGNIAIDYYARERAKASKSTDPFEREYGERLVGENRKNYLKRAGRSIDTLNNQNDNLVDDPNYDQIREFQSANELLVYYDSIGIIDKKNKTINVWNNRVAEAKNKMRRLRVKMAPMYKEKSRQHLQRRGLKGRTILSGQPTSQSMRPRVAQPSINSATTGTTLIRTG